MVLRGCLTSKRGVSIEVNKRAQLQGWGIAALRLVTGVLFLISGVQKFSPSGLSGASEFLGRLGIPWPTAAVIGVLTVEVFCGAALVLGLFTRWVSTPLAIGMLVDVLFVHPPTGFLIQHTEAEYALQTFIQHTESEYALLRLTASVALVLTGPGKLALDNLLEKR